MKTTEFRYSGKTLHLFLNGQAMFDLQALDAETPEDAPDILDRAREQTPAGFDALCAVAHVLAQQGENCRRYLKYAPNRVPGAEELRLLLSPMQLVGLRTAVFQAIHNGYTAPTADDDDDIDTGLLELEKKTGA
ncbi:MAG: hypothetical protein IJ960_00910 [Oscillospiraceae bacterium]|nr:hypothetical protein [Oscillospiraceae bacterium]